MKSITLCYREFGNPLDVLEINYREDTLLNHDEVLVRMKFSPINPSDLIPIRGAYRHRIQLPAIPGYEGVGVVEEIGSSVSCSLLGKRVLPLRGEGTWQQYVRTSAKLAIPVPGDIDNETASQTYINPITAWLICTEELRLKSDDVLVVNACGSAIGRIFAQLSKLWGYRLIALVRNDSSTEELLSLGAWAVLNTSKTPIREAVKELTHGIGANAGIDSIGGVDGHDLIECVRPNGTVLSIGLLSGVPLNWEQISRDYRHVTVKPYWLRRWIEGVSDTRWHQVFHEVFTLVQKRQLLIHPARSRFRLQQYQSAVREAELNGRKGKVLFASDD
ncbi:zinc-dependent alcohol dehydrogenase family protein [Alicyclobacillus sp. ALC3]|uniref:zinc-dependent alcohol dehydrogenase family protein n=1 Tax=Alicyclobacillus sp. ALC3 TaxID=2796143 RepID=UPI00237944AF|nr:zinc-dependent alcohol dehydrogenase family protein [Alicyclobacillus sp. ALC3]WDL99420.1 zinc-dependent alcohol dehydrogenase family protein [Alicyclobacillus sp. ALC3]